MLAISSTCVHYCIPLCRNLLTLYEHQAAHIGETVLLFQMFCHLPSVLETLLFPAGTQQQEQQKRAVICTTKYTQHFILKNKNTLVNNC